MEVGKVILERRSVRFFEQDPISKEVIDELLKAAINAPNANNAQQWYFVVVKSVEKREKLRELLIDAYLNYLTDAREDIDEKTMEKVRNAISSGLYQAPLYIAFYSDMRNKILRKSYEEFEERMIVQSISAAIENVLLRAWDLGLGSVWLGVALLKEEEINELLEIPKGLKLEAIVALGRPARVGKKRPRKPISEVSKVVRGPTLLFFLSPLLLLPLELLLRSFSDKT